MVWKYYFVNSLELCRIGENEKDICFLHDLKIPPHGGIREEWNTTGMKHGASRILFVEYTKEDDDPDGVWAAYGMKAESVYKFTVNADEADSEKMFVYTLYNDGSLGVGFDVDTESAEAILAFLEPQAFDAEKLMKVTQKAKEEFCNSDTVVKLVKDALLNGADDVICLAFFKV